MDSWEECISISSDEEEGPDDRIQVFLAACKSGNTSHLRSLIEQGNFNVRGLLYRSGITVLHHAIKDVSLPVVQLLLECGADANAENGWALTEAIPRRKPELVRLLLDWGADPNGNNLCHLVPAVNLRNLEIVKLLLDRGARVTPAHIDGIHSVTVKMDAETLEILKLLMDRASRLLDDPWANQESRRLGNYALICKAILQDDKDMVTELLKNSDYEDYAEVLYIQDLSEYNETRPGSLAARFGSLEVIKAFVSARIDLNYIYWEAARNGNLDALEMCLTSSGFDRDVRNLKGQTALHLTFPRNQLEVVKVLVHKYGLDLNALDSDGWSPIFIHSQSPEEFKNILTTFPEINLNLRARYGCSLLVRNKYRCDLYAILLEHGCDPRSRSKDMRHKCYRGIHNHCTVYKYLQKLALIDPEYVERIVPMVLERDIEEFSNMKAPDEEEYNIEIKTMQNFRISQSTSSVPAKTLYNLLFFGANGAARYCRSEIVLSLYATHKEDFSNYLPHYGFRLNYQFRRGAIRRERLDSANELLCSALGVGLPENFAELIFGYFSNSALEHFITAMTD